MRKLILLLVIGAAAAQAQPGCTQITQTLYQAGGRRPVPMNGTITLSQGYTAQNGSFVVVESQAPIQIVNGALSACLSPASYEADYSVNPIPPLDTTVQFTRYWNVPVTGCPCKLTDIPAGASGPIEGQTFAPPMPQTFAVGATGPVGPQGPSGTGNAPFPVTITARTSLTVSAATHGQGTTPVAFCYYAGAPISCSAVPDPSGNVTFTFPVPFTGSAIIMGGGTGPRGPIGPVGPQGTPGLPTPPAFGTYCVQVTNQVFYYLPGSCGVLTLLWTQLTNSQWTSMTDAQWFGLGNGPSPFLSWTGTTNSQWTGMTNSQWTGMTN